MRLTSEQAAQQHVAQTEAWGLAHEPSEPDGAYFARVAAHWKTLANETHDGRATPDYRTVVS